MARVVKYNVRVCEKCKEEYLPRSSTQSWCDKCLTKKCEYCRSEFHVQKKTKFETAKFCSVECKGKYSSAHYVGKNSPAYKNGNRTKVKIICDNCGNDTYKEQQHVDNWVHNFCGRECQIDFYRKPENKLTGKDSPKYSQVDVKCEWCGKPFKSYLSTRDKVRFCSKKCRNDWQSDMMKGENHYNWQGGKSKERALDMVSREYREWRKSVFERDAYTCQSCGDDKGGNLRAHHIKYYKDYPLLRHDTNNGITLCEKCHIKIHSKN